MGHSTYSSIFCNCCQLEREWDRLWLSFYLSMQMRPTQSGLFWCWVPRLTTGFCCRMLVNTKPHTDVTKLWSSAMSTLYQRYKNSKEPSHSLCVNNRYRMADYYKCVASDRGLRL